MTINRNAQSCTLCAAGENNIPFSAFNEIFKESENSVKFLSLLRFGNENLNYNNEDIPIQKRKRGKRY